MALLQTHPEMLLDHRAQRHAFVPEQAASELGVEQRGRVQAQLGQAGQILVRGVQDPLRVPESLAQRGEGGQRDRVDERGADPGPAKLHKVGPLAVAVARGTLGIECDGAGAAAHEGNQFRELARTRDRLGDAVDRFTQQRDGRCLRERHVAQRGLAVPFAHISPRRAR